MVIKRVTSKLADYKVGKGDVTSITLTNHGNKKTTMYLIKHGNQEDLWLGLLEHKVEYMQEQTTIFDYL